MNASHNGCIKDFFEVFLSQSGAFDVRGGFDFLGTEPCGLLRHRLLFAFVKLNEYFDVFSEVRLGPDENNRGLGAVTSDFRDPFLGHILER